ncbi:MAG: hypothetical protein Q9180_008822 [Flavoplaca navasiana]
MQYSSVFLAALAATTALAAPWKHQTPTDNNLEVTLSGASSSAVTTSLPESPETTVQPSSTGPFTYVALRVGQGVRNQASRCQILNEAGNPIVIQRGANTDITFADGGKGLWKFRDGASLVSSISCSPKFQQITGSAIQTESEIRVQLADSGSELAIQVAFDPSGERQEKTVNPGPFSTVQIMVGALVRKQDYRCQVLDKAGQPLVATRGANRDTTFADGGKAEWTFDQKSEVSKVICDPAFKAAPAASA